MKYLPLIIVASLIGGFLMLSPMDSMIKDWALETAELPVDDKTVDAVYDFKMDCSIFNSKADCLAIIKSKIERSTTINSSDKKYALTIAEKLI